MKDSERVTSELRPTGQEVSPLRSGGKIQEPIMASAARRRERTWHFLEIERRPVKMENNNGMGRYRRRWVGRQGW